MKYFCDQIKTNEIFLPQTYWNYNISFTYFKEIRFVQQDKHSYCFSSLSTIYIREEKYTTTPILIGRGSQTFLVRQLWGSQTFLVRQLWGSQTFLVRQLWGSQTFLVRQLWGSQTFLVRQLYSYSENWVLGAVDKVLWWENVWNNFGMNNIQRIKRKMPFCE
jgi:hypothetical protein